MKKKLLIIGIIALVVVLAVFSLGYVYMSGMMAAPDNEYHSSELEDEVETYYPHDEDLLMWAWSDMDTLTILSDQLSYRVRYSTDYEDMSRFANHMINISKNGIERYNGYTLLSSEVEKIKEKGLETLNIFKQVGYLALSEDSDFFEEIETGRYHLKIWHDMLKEIK